MENQEKNFTFYNNHPKSPTASLEFIFDGKYGNFEICIQYRAPQAPNPTDCARRETIDASYGGAAQSYRKVKFDPKGDKSQVTGDFNVIIKAHENTGLIFGVVENDVSTGSYLSKEIKAGVSVSETLENFEKASFFTFRLDASEEVHAVQINLTPLRGRFIIAVRNDNNKPDLDQKFWKSDTNEIAITVDDQLFKPNGVYTIGVFPILPADANLASEFHYHLRWSYTGKHSLLLPGIPHYGTLAHTRECFIFEINSNWNTVIVAKHSSSKNIDLYASVGNSHDVPSAEKFDFKALADESGFSISKEKLDNICRDEFSKQRHCNAYLCMHGTVKEQFMIAFTFNTTPFLLQEGSSFFGPIPVKDEVLHFIFHPIKGAPCDIEEFSASWAVSMEASLMESPSSIPFPAITSASHSLTNLKHFSRDSIAAFKKPLIAITVARRTGATPAATEDFNFGGSFGLEAGYLLKELIRGNQRLGFAEKGEWKYYYIYNSEPSATLFVGMDSLNQGDGDIFISRGKDRRPTDKSFLARSMNIRSAYLMLPVEKIQGKGYKDLRGFYTVGVKANSDLRFSISWRHTRSNIIYASTGYKTTSIIQPGQPLRIVYYNLFDSDIELQMNSHHHAVALYWTVESPNTVYRENTMELFPNENRHMLKYIIDKDKGFKTYLLPKTTTGFCNRCNWFFTIESFEKEDPIDFEFKIMVAGDKRNSFTEEIHVGKFYDIEAQVGDIRHFRLPVSAAEYKDINRFYIETHSIVGTNEVLISTKPITSAADATVRKQVSVGYSTVSLADLKLDQNRAPIPAVYVSISCNNYCRMKFAPVEPGKYLQLVPNHPREGISNWAAGNETFIYSSDGLEKYFEVNFQIEYFIDHAEVELAKEELFRMIRVYYAPDQASFQNGKKTTLETRYSHADRLNNRVILDYKPRKGVFLIEVASIPQTGYAYTLRVQTHPVSTLYPGRHTVGEIRKHSAHHKYEVSIHRPGSVFMKLAKCYGNVNLAVKGGNDNYGYQQTSIDGDRYTKIHESQKGETIYLRMQKESTSLGAFDFGYLDHTKNVSIYAMEVFEKQAWDSIPFDHIRPQNEDLYIDLKGSEPVLRFRPINMPAINIAHQIIYHVVVSHDPEVLHYYMNCGGAYLTKVLKKGLKKKDAIQVFSLGVNPQTQIEFGTNQLYLQKNLKLESGKRYFASVVAFIKLNKPNGSDRFMTSNSMRVYYRVINFEYRSFFYPIELMASTLGLIAVFLASICLGNTSISNILKKFKRATGNNNQIDSDLEEYYMQIKNDFDYEEKVRAASKPSSGGNTVDNSVALDTSMVSSTSTKKKKEKLPDPKGNILAEGTAEVPKTEKKAVELTEVETKSSVETKKEVKPSVPQEVQIEIDEEIEDPKDEDDVKKDSSEVPDLI